MENHAYGPLLDFVGHALRKPRRGTPPAHIPATALRALLQEAETTLGMAGVERLGREVADVRGHPVATALRMCRDPRTFFRLWERVETFTHATHRVRTLTVNETGASLERHTTSGGLPLLVEDRFVMGILVGFLEALGARDVRMVGGRETAEARQWELRWASLGRPAPARAGRAWGAPGAFAGSVLVALMEGVPATLRSVAGHLGVSARSLQRRLGDAGTSFSELVALHRMAVVDASLGPRSNLTRVAQDAGFSDGAHFSREFRRLVGVSPSRWRSMMAP